VTEGRDGDIGSC